MIITKKTKEGFIRYDRDKDKFLIVGKLNKEIEWKFKDFIEDKKKKCWKK